MAEHRRKKRIFDTDQGRSALSQIYDRKKDLSTGLSFRPKLNGLADLPPGFERADLLLTKCITPPAFLAAISSVVAKSRPAGAQSE